VTHRLGVQEKGQVVVRNTEGLGLPSMGVRGVKAVWKRKRVVYGRLWGGDGQYGKNRHPNLIYKRPKVGEPFWGGGW